MNNIPEIRKTCAMIATQLPEVYKELKELRVDPKNIEKFTSLLTEAITASNAVATYRGNNDITQLDLVGNFSDSVCKFISAVKDFTPEELQINENSFWCEVVILDMLQEDLDGFCPTFDM